MKLGLKQLVFKFVNSVAVIILPVLEVVYLLSELFLGLSQLLNLLVLLVDGFLLAVALSLAPINLILQLLLDLIVAFLILLGLLSHHV